MNVDFTYMREALTLAAKGLGQISPNPMVGALIVKEQEIIGQGFCSLSMPHHAEITALAEAKELARDATMYINLEPCSKSEFDISCTEAIIEAGIKRLVISTLNPKERGKGLERIKEAGIELVLGLAEEESLRLNEVFVTYSTKMRPFIHLKTTVSLDGHIATHTAENKWITNDAISSTIQELRYCYDATLVGADTILTDDPLLTYRGNKKRHNKLIRIILDPNLDTPINSHLVQTADESPVWVFTSSNTSENKVIRFQKSGVQIFKIPINSNQSIDNIVFDLQEIVTILAKKQITSLLIEGGAEIANSFFRTGLVDKATFFVAPLIIGGRLTSNAPNNLPLLQDSFRLIDVVAKHVGNNVMITGYPINSVGF